MGDGMLMRATSSGDCSVGPLTWRVGNRLGCVLCLFFYFLMLFFVWYSSASLYLALCICVSAASVALYMLTTPHVFSFRCKYAGLRGEIICLIFLGYLIEKGKLILSIRACWDGHVLLFTSLISAYMELCSIKIQGSPLSWGNGGIDSLQVIFIFGVVFFSLCPPGGAGEAAASGQPHPGSLRKCQNSQKWQLFSIRKTYRRSPFSSLFVCLFFRVFCPPFVTRTVFTSLAFCLFFP